MRLSVGAPCHFALFVGTSVAQNGGQLTRQQQQFWRHSPQETRNIKHGTLSKQVTGSGLVYLDDFSFFFLFFFSSSSSVLLTTCVTSPPGWPAHVYGLILCCGHLDRPPSVCVLCMYTSKLGRSVRPLDSSPYSTF